MAEPLDEVTARSEELEEPPVEEPAGGADESARGWFADPKPSSENSTPLITAEIVLSTLSWLSEEDVSLEGKPAADAEGGLSMGSSPASGGTGLDACTVAFDCWAVWV